MARPSVDVHPDATAEARAAFLWYSERNPLAASAFISELDHAVREIRTPERWPRYLHGTRKFLFRRFHSVTYRVTDAAIQVIAVANQRRRPKTRQL